MKYLTAIIMAAGLTGMSCKKEQKEERLETQIYVNANEIGCNSADVILEKYRYSITCDESHNLSHEINRDSLHWGEYRYLDEHRPTNSYHPTSEVDWIVDILVFKLNEENGMRSYFTYRDGMENSGFVPEEIDKEYARILSILNYTDVLRMWVNLRKDLEMNRE